MRLEDMENEFPKMPMDMRKMVEQEVEKQIKTASAVQYKRRKGMARKTFVAALVAVMALGTTVFAGVIYHMHSVSVGKYAVQTKIEGNPAAETPGADTEGAADSLEIPAVKMELGYLPEGMIEVEEGKYCYEDAVYGGGVSLCFYRMDTGDNQFDMIVKDVLSREDITLGEYEGVYMELNSLDEGIVNFDKRIYVAYTDVHYVMEMFAAQDVTKEDAIKIAENVKLIPVGDGEGEMTVSGYDWSSHLASLKEDEERGGTEGFSNTTMIRASMTNTHTVGESFSLANAGTKPNEGLTVKVADVQVADDISLLDESYIDDDMKKELQGETDADGVLLPANINYMKYGDGVNTVSEIVDSRETPQKLVYITVEYTNNGTSELTDLLFAGGLSRIKEDGDQMVVYNGEQPGPEDDWDAAVFTGVAMYREMYYYDVHGGTRGNNYIPSIQPGETVTVHMAWIVPEEELGYLYLSLDPFGGYYEFNDHVLGTGYVDIRQ